MNTPTLLYNRPSAMAHSFQFHTNSPQPALYPHSLSSNYVLLFQFPSSRPQIRSIGSLKSLPPTRLSCSLKPTDNSYRTCKVCKIQFDPSDNHPRACRFHPAHFGGETKRKFESVYSGGTMNTPNGGQVLEYWHCCGSEDPFDQGCTAAPHSTYDD